MISNPAIDNCFHFFLLFFFLMFVTLSILAIRNTSSFFLPFFVFWNNFKLTEQSGLIQRAPINLYPDSLIVENLYLLYHSFSKYTFMCICICIFFPEPFEQTLPLNSKVWFSRQVAPALTSPQNFLKCQYSGLFLDLLNQKLWVWDPAVCGLAYSPDDSNECWSLRTTA